MGFFLMKVATWLLSPLGLALAGVALGGVWLARGQERRGRRMLCAAWLWLWVWSSPWCFFRVGGALERQYPPTAVTALPKADAIVLLGGGMASPNARTRYPELYGGADRGWHAARCYHAGRAPVILFSGVSEGPGMQQFLKDLGVPTNRVLLETASKNTYENSLFVRERLRAMQAKKVILVTSAWHMRRSVMTFERMGMTVVPAGCDYEALSIQGWLTPSSVLYYLPSPEFLARNSAAVKEHLGYWAYALYLRVKRR